MNNSHNSNIAIEINEHFKMQQHILIITLQSYEYICKYANIIDVYGYFIDECTAGRAGLTGT